MNTSFLIRLQPLLLPPFEREIFWIIDLDMIQEKEVDEAKRFLDEATLSKAQNLIFREDQNRKIIIHAILRYQIGKFIDQEPHKVEILLSELGKPYLQNNCLYFNLSYTKQYAFLGFHDSKPIGVDIEMIQKQEDILKIANYFMHPIEKKLIDQSTHPEEQFFNLWCAKEALLKAIGTGFSIEKLPILEYAFSLTDSIHLYKNEDQEIYVYNQRVRRHKLAVCLKK